MSLDLTINTLQFNGNNAINIIFIGDGFTSGQTASYHTKVGEAVTGFFSFDPFSGHTNNFNIYSIPTVSVDSGISTITHPNNPITPIIKNTFLGAYFNRGGMIRLTGFEKREELELELTKHFQNRVFVILISNTGTYGGSGEFPENKFMTVTHITMETQYNTFDKLMMHEFGHSFCGLADEYGGNCTTDRPADWALPYYDRPNVTDDIINKRKWDGILNNPQYIAGANYCNSTWYRSSNQGLMRGWFQPGDLDEKHNELGVYLINKRINEELASNEKTATYISDDKLRDRFNLKLKPTKQKNIRVNGVLRVDKPISCDNLWVNKGATLIIGPGGSIRCKKLVNNGTIDGENKINFFH